MGLCGILCLEVDYGLIKLLSSQPQKVMVCFCPWCGTMLMVVQGPDCKNLLSCNVCPYISEIVNPIVTIHPAPNRADRGGVVNLEQEWKRGELTDARCSRCGNHQAYFTQMQTRSADEPMTVFYRCSKYSCGHIWRE